MSGTLRIWDTTQLEHPLKIELKVLSGPIADIAWSADSQRLVVVGDGKVLLFYLFIFFFFSQHSGTFRSGYPLGFRSERGRDHWTLQGHRLL
jgi:hypothetical protein